MPEHCEQLGHRPFLRSGRPIDVVGGHGVEGLDDGDHPRPRGMSKPQRESRSGCRRTRPARFRRSPASARELQLRRRISKPILRERVITAASFASNAARFQQDVVRRADHADIVQQRGDFDGVALGIGQIQLCGPRRAVSATRKACPAVAGVLALQRRKQTGRHAQAGLHQLVVDRLAEHRGQRVTGRRYRLQLPQQTVKFRQPTIGQRRSRDDFGGNDIGRRQ